MIEFRAENPAKSLVMLSSMLVQLLLVNEVLPPTTGGFVSMLKVVIPAWKKDSGYRGS
jgi:hypothetical protein